MAVRWRDRITGHLTRYWLIWFVFVAIAIAVSVGMATGIERLYDRWRFAYNHSWLVVPMAAWLMVAALRQAPPREIGPSWVGMLGLGGVVLIYTVAESLAFTLGMQAALPAVLYAAIAAILGLRFAWAVAIPVGFLYFTVPVWDLANGVLQDISTAAVSWLLQFSNVTAHIDLYYITIPSGTFEIAEGCAGLSYLIVGLVLAVFYALTWLRRWRTRVLLAVVAAVASMAANWMRIYTLILIGHWTEMQHYLIQVSHDTYGWVVFLVAMMPVLILARWLENREPAAAEADAGSAAVSVHRASAPSFLLAGVVAAGLVASPALLGRGPEAPDEPHSVAAIESVKDGWREVAPSGRWSPGFVAPHLVVRQAFAGPEGTHVDVYIARYLSRQFDSKLIASRNELAPQWRAVDVDARRVAVADAQREVRETRLKRGADERLVWSWFVVGGWTAEGTIAAKLLEIPALFAGRRDGAVIAVSAACRDNCTDAEAALQASVRAYGERLESVGNGALDP